MRDQGHPALLSRQLGYRLPFREQVREAQGPLPCFPPAALASRRPPFLDRVPASPVPRRRRYYEGATTSRSRISRSLIGFAPGSHAILLAVRARRRRRSRTAGGAATGQDHWSAGDPPCRRLARGHEWDLSGSQAIHPVPLLRSTTPAEPTIPSQWRSHRCCPCQHEGKGFSVTSISGLPRGLQLLLSTLHEWCCHHPCKTRFRLAG